MSKNEILYLHENKNKSIINGNVIIHEEEIKKSSGSLKFKYYHKEGNKIEKMSGTFNGQNFLVFISSGTQTDKKTLSLDDTIDFLSKNKKYKFVVDYLKQLKANTQKGRGRVGRRNSKSTLSNGRSNSRSNSKKTKRTSRKRSKKTRRNSRKRSR